MTDDIVDTLRRNHLYIPTSRINSFGRPQMGFELTSFNLIAADAIERLRAERDEARRMWCEAAPVGNCLSVDDMNRRARAEAKRRGWDCFKENTDDR
jgi:hypothetical protein